MVNICLQKKQPKEQKFNAEYLGEYNLKTICNLYIASNILQILKEGTEDYDKFQSGDL